MPAKPSVSASSARCLRGHSTVSLPSMPISTAPVTLQDVFPGIAADNLSAMPASRQRFAPANLDPTTLLVGPEEEVPVLGDRSCRTALELAHAVAQKTRRGDRSVSVLPSQILRCLPVVPFYCRRYRLLWRHVDPDAPRHLQLAAWPNRGDCDPALFPPALMDELQECRHPLNPFDRQRAPSNDAIALDDVLVTALQRESSEF